MKYLLANIHNRWVFNTLLPADRTTGHQNIYDPKKSRTFKVMPGSSFSVGYGDGSYTRGSTVGTETVSIGGASVPNQVIELPSTVADQFVKDTASNGLVGLGFSNANNVLPEKATTFLDTIKDDLHLPVFTASLKHGATGAYSFGKIDSTQYTGQLVYTEAMNLQGHWGFQSNSFAVGNGQLQTNSTASPAIADTGTSLLLMDPNVAEGYYAHVSGASKNDTLHGWVFPCNAILPDFHFAVGPHYTNTIPGNLMMYVQIGADICYGALQSNNWAGLQILGDVLFKAQFVVFNIADMQLGFADHA